MATNNTYINMRGAMLQSDRMPNALAEDFFRLDERSMEDYIAQVARFAKQMTFYDKTGKATWETFFKVDVHELKRQMDAGCVEPHYTLLLAFLKLYGHQQRQLNAMMKRSLDFYYKDVLGFTPRKGCHGTVPVFFELTKNIPSAFVPKGTLFVAGKDSNGKPITYASMNDLIVNNAKIVECKRLTSKGLKYMPVNGVKRSEMLDNSYATYEVCIPLPDINKVNGIISIDTTSMDSKAYSMEYTTNKGWSKAASIGNMMVITAADPRFATYNKKIHGGNFAVNSPLIRFTCTKKEQVRSVFNWAYNITITISNSTQFVIENKYGLVENKKGALPFGPSCQKGDSFTIRFPLKAHSQNINIDDNMLSYLKPRDRQSPTFDMMICSDGQCIISLNTDDYDQYVYPVEYAKFLVNKLSEEPQRKKLLELESPIKATYSTFYNARPFIFVPDLRKTYSSYQIFDAFLDMAYRASSELFIHIEGIEKAGSLSLYFDMNPIIDPNGHIEKWSYFNGTRWKDFSIKELTRDSTNKLYQSGIIGLNIPIDHVEWIKASFNCNYDYRAIRNINTHVVELQYADDSKGDGSVGKSLPAGTIKKSLNAIPGIRSVIQLYDGNTGRADETEEQFTCRVSEKLRHKGRAWAAWDYERLVLEKFPNLSSVQCFPSYNKEYKLSPGSVLLTVIPQAESNAAEHKLKPQVNAKDIKAIEDYLKSCTSCHVSVYVANPQYDKIQVSCKLSLKADCADEDYFKPILNDLLTEFLAPWTTSLQDSSLYGRSLNESEIMAFISRQPFVDKLWHTEVTINGNAVEKGAYIYPLGIGHILTSADEHFINIGAYE